MSSFTLARLGVYDTITGVQIPAQASGNIQVANEDIPSTTSTLTFSFRMTVHKRGVRGRDSVPDGVPMSPEAENSDSVWSGHKV